MFDEEKAQDFKTIRPLRKMTKISLPSTVNPKSLSPGGPIFENLAELNPEEQQARDKLMRYIVAEDIWKGTVYNACSWYSQYLQSKFLDHWHALSAALVGLDEESKAPKNNEFIILFEFMRKVAEIFKTQSGCALTDIVDKLSNDGLLKDQLDDVRAIPNQVVFAAVGWLTMLYEAIPRPTRFELQISATSSSAKSGAPNSSLSRKYPCDRQGFDNVDRPFYEMLEHFGQLIPGPQMQSLYLRENPARGFLNVQSVSFATLQKIANLRIIWVSSLALHLELDSGKKTLKLFQYPSFCRIMTVERKRNLLSRFLNDHAGRNCDDGKSADFLTDKFFEEILLTYRILFGQDDRSWKTRFRQMAISWEAEQTAEKPWPCDPLLKSLCAQSCLSEGAKTIYKEREAGDLDRYYDPHLSFPFFAGRLIELQDFVKHHQSPNLRGVLTSKREVAALWNLWRNQLLIFFATLTIYFVLSQIFQMWQMILTKEQLRQGYNLPN